MRSTDRQLIDVRRLRHCLGHFATGVTVVTTRVDGAIHGLTVNAFTSVSLDPPLVLVSIDRRSKARELLHGNDYVVNILPAGDESLALHFAGAVPAEHAIEWEEGACGPRLASALAHLECSPWAAHEAGDHVLFIGRVERFEVSGGDPLLFYAGAFHALPAPPPLWTADVGGGGWLGDGPWQAAELHPRPLAP